MGTPATISGAGVRWTTGELAARLGADLIGPADLPIARLDTLDDADGMSVAFIRDKGHSARWASSAAAAAIVTRGAEPDGHDGVGRALIVVEDADRALLDLLGTVTPEHAVPAGVHASAVVHDGAEIDASARLGANVVVGPGARVGAGTVLHAGVVVGAEVRIGEGCDIRSGVVIEDRCVLGDRVMIHPNAVIGADGFGYTPGVTPSGAHGPVKIPHAGTVEIGHDVEIGSCTTIDRGKFGATRIGDGTKIDNLVQIGHNCRIGRSVVICGAAGVSGSVVIGDGATVGGGAGLRDNITIGAGARIGAQSGVMNDVPAGASWVGAPACPAREAMQIMSANRRLPAVLRKLKKMGFSLDGQEKQG